MAKLVFERLLPVDHLDRGDDFLLAGRRIVLGRRERQRLGHVLAVLDGDALRGHDLAAERERQLDVAVLEALGAQAERDGDGVLDEERVLDDGVLQTAGSPAVEPPMP